MATTQAPNHRASLLAGLRTGGVRATSGTIPHTAAPGGSFSINVPRFTSSSQYNNNNNIFPAEQDQDAQDEYDDQVLESQPHSFPNSALNRAIPMTAAVDGPNNRFMQQQQQVAGGGLRGMNPNSVPFSPAYGQPMPPQATPANNQQAAIQMQMMQLEILRMQAIQAQQYQAELLAQAQRQQAQQAQNRRMSAGFAPPATAGPLSNSFDLRSATLSAQLRRASNQVPGLSAEGEATGPVPMTAALNGRFGTRSSIGNLSSRFEEHEESSSPVIMPSTPTNNNSSTTVISGGTPLGKPGSNNINNNANSNNASPATITKSDSSSSWRRGGNNNSVLSGLNRAGSASPSVKITPPAVERNKSLSPSPPPGTTTSSSAAPSPTATKARPIPLRFNLAAAQPMLPAVSIDNADGSDTNNENSSSDGSNKDNSPPTSPQSASSSNDVPLSPREEAAKKLYEGLGIGRPAPPGVSGSINNNNNHFNRLASSQPTRQPRGPPSGADELGPKNFATRIRRKAIGGLGVLLGARERRDFVQAF